MTLSLPRTAVALSLLLALAACGGKDESPAAEAQTSAATERTAAGAAPVPEPGAAASAPAPAASPAAGGAITPEDVRAYRLSMDNVRKLHEAERAWLRSGGKPSQPSAVDLGPTPTLADGANLMLRHFDNDPKAVAAMSKSGLSTREAAIHTMVVTQAMMAAAGAAPASEIAQENVEFVRANQAELRRLADERRAALQVQERRP